tara:strand:+ start:2275 stop:3342 length:1068 start_codon:yes stop_codon:yes gene_type:complete
MGIKYFNRYLRDNCSHTAIQRIDFKHLSGRRIVIDTSIFLYRFKKKNALLEHMFLLISLFDHYKIIPLFVFDGQPPEEKRQVLLQRVAKKKEAREKMWDLIKQVKDLDLVGDTTHTDTDITEEIARLKYKIVQLEKESTRITKKDFEKVKKLMDLCNIMYINAPEEADQLCAYLVNSGIAWACMTDDMDMFTYNCKRVLREPNMMTHDMMLYNTDEIIQEMDIPHDGLILLLLLLGTDYHTVDDIQYPRIDSFHTVLDWYKTYEKDQFAQSSHIWFYPWLVQREVITSDFEKELWNLHRIFGTQYNRASNYLLDEKNGTELEKRWVKQTPIISSAKHELKQFLALEEGFIFADEE